MLLIVQLSMLAVARTTVSGLVDGAARRAAMDPATLDEIEASVAGQLRTAVAGIDVIDVDAAQDAARVTVSATYRWHAPGPDFIPIVMTVERSRMVAVPP
jgi:hypothetical protein